jgi:hypothetical protein
VGRYLGIIEVQRSILEAMETNAIKLKGDSYKVDHRFDYPNGFDDALRKVYERSFVEVEREFPDNVDDFKAACLADCPTGGQSTGAQSTGLRLNIIRSFFDSQPDFDVDRHTVMMCALGRPDLTIESVILSDKWRNQFPPRTVGRAERRLEALAYLTEQQLALDEGQEVAKPSPKLEAAGYKTYTYDNRAYIAIRGFLSGYNDRSWDGWGCQGPGAPLEHEDGLDWLPILPERGLWHPLTCQSCAKQAPRVFELSRRIARDAFLRTRTFLENLLLCLDLSKARIRELSARIGSEDEAKYALTWRAFLLASYMRDVANTLETCIQCREDENPWAKLRAGDCLPETVDFTPPLTEEEFEALLLAYEMPSSWSGYWPFRFAAPGKLPSVPSAGEDLKAIPGFLSIRENATVADWSEFMAETLPEDMPLWGFRTIEEIMTVAAKAAKAELARCNLAATEVVRGGLWKTIEEQLHAIYGAQAPMMASQEETIRAVRDAAQAQAQAQSEQTILLRQFLRRPGVREAESSLKHILGEDIFDGLCEEARYAAVEGERLYLQVAHAPGECSDPSIIPFQFAKAFECQLQYILEAYSPKFRFSAKEISRDLENDDKKLLAFLKQKNIDHRLLRRQHEKLFGINAPRNQAAHRATIRERRARELRDEYLGVSKGGDNIFRAVVPSPPEARHDPSSKSV